MLRITMVKTLKELCEREPELAASIKERLLTIGHELVGEYILDSKTQEKIQMLTLGERTASEYIRDMLYNARVIPNGSFEQFLESIASEKTEQNTEESHEFELAAV